MIREAILSAKIALLATGDELCQGDIINSNSQEISRRLTENGIAVRMHLTAPDTIPEIVQALGFLLDLHNAVIITGGLGPTSDDLTRYALSKVTNKSLVFDALTWENICARLRTLGHLTPAESNRQQALFPETATIIPNLHGTAAGCMLKLQEKYIFMLPGPPHECLPMVDSLVIPTLKNAGFSHFQHFQKWLLFNVSEGIIAEKLDALAKPYRCTTGYRICYPYIEFKLFSESSHEFMALLPLIEQAIQPYLIKNGQKTASHYLQELLVNLPENLVIFDQATGGNLESALKTPQNAHKLRFIVEDTQAPDIKITGLNNFWTGQRNESAASIHLIFTTAHSTKEIQAEIPFRGARVIEFAVEFICEKIINFLENPL